ncbi:hypothetical protein [Paraburkholderia sp. 2C]
MADIIEKLAQLNVPNELLGNVDVDEVLNRFRRIFRQLDDLKKFRTEHEQRNVFMRWLNSDQLDTAQLNAQQVQAEFSKTLGQLMVISMFQARKLESQQGQLLSQQAEIRQLSESIDRHTAALADEHAKLFEQGEEVKRLVKDSLDIQYTLDTERKLIAIASQVAKSRDDLVAAFDIKLTEMGALAEQTEHAVADQIGRLTERFDRREKEFHTRAQIEAANQAEQYREQEAAWLERLSAIERDVVAKLQASVEREQAIVRELKAEAADRERNRQAAQKEVEKLNQDLGELRTALAAQQVTLQTTRQWAADKVRRLRMSIWTLALCATAGIGTAYVLLGHVSGAR